MTRVVLVTGAGSGIGLATALRLAEVGFDVRGLVPDRNEADSLLREAEARSVKVPAVVADLASPAARADIASDIAPWGLVNNAGYMNAGRIMDVPLDDARLQFEVMVMAPADLCRQVLPAMIARGQGRIVNVTSSASHTSTPLTGWYAAAKAALREVNDALRVELQGTGVDVVDVEPGGYRTGIWDRAATELRRRRPPSGPESRTYDRMLRHLDEGERLMDDPQDVAEAIGDLMTVGKPPRHLRIGAGARSLRTMDALAPDRIWDRLVGAVARPGTGSR